jgi:hypothetical protein
MKTDLPMTSVDELGMLLAQIDTLTARADQIKDSLKDAATAGGAVVFDGAMFRATVVEANRRVTDWKGIQKELGIPEDVIIAHTKVTAVFTVRTTSR